MSSRSKTKTRGRTMSRRYNRRVRSGSLSSRSYSSYSRGRPTYTSYIPKAMGFIAPRQICRLKYSENFNLSLASSATQQQVFNLNSLFDPNRTGVGHQPYGYDQLATLYNRYRVYKSYWIITVPATDQPLYVVAVPVNGVHTFTNNTDACEYPRGVHKAIAYNGGQVTYLKGRISLPKLGGVKKSQYWDDDRYAAATFSADPTETLTLSVVITNPGTATTSIKFNVTLLMRCEVWDPLVENQS